jgi:hypothetical protein
MLNEATNQEKLELMRVKLEVLKIAVSESKGSKIETIELFTKYMELISVKTVTST